MGSHSQQSLAESSGGGSKIGSSLQKNSQSMYMLENNSNMGANGSIAGQGGQNQ